MEALEDLALQISYELWFTKITGKWSTGDTILDESPWTTLQKAEAREKARRKRRTKLEMSCAEHLGLAWRIPPKGKNVVAALPAKTGSQDVGAAEDAGAKSSVELIPTPRSAWTLGKDDDRAHPAPGDGKMSVTVSVALPLGETMPLFSQIIFKGETARDVPTDDPLENMCLDHSLSQWQTAELETLLLDHAPIHATQEFKTKVAEQFPHVALLFLDRGCTSVIQPCDTHAFGPFKYQVRQAWMKGYIGSVIALQTEMGKLRKLPKVRADFVSLVDVGLKATRSLGRRKAAWARLSCNDSNLFQVLDEADELHTDGLLFPTNAEQEIVAVEDGAAEDGVAEQGEETDECEAEDVCEDVNQHKRRMSTLPQSKPMTLARSVGLLPCGLVYGSARRSDFAAASSV
eukprot:2294143-Amphidinium_carterae.1